MPWWRKREWSDDGPLGEEPPQGARLAEKPADGDVRVRIPVQTDRRTSNMATPVTIERVQRSLKRLGIRYLTDENGDLLAMWERHLVLFALEGQDNEILVMRARAYSTLPADWCGRAHAATNEWNHTRRFLKSYVGEPTEKGRLAIYAEMQLPLVPGVHEALLDEVVDCVAAVSGSWADWLYDDGALL